MLFYKGLAVQVSNSGHAIDLFGGRLDQVGLLEMRSLPNRTNGVVYPVIVCFSNFLSLRVLDEDFLKLEVTNFASTVRKNSEIAMAACVSTS